jgi:hypothetical protein
MTIMIETKNMEIKKAKDSLLKAIDCLEMLGELKQTQREYGRELISETDPVYRYELEQRIAACSEEAAALMVRYGDNLLDAIILPNVEKDKLD